MPKKWKAKIYVDTCTRYINGFWCHLWSEDLEELKRFASWIDVKKSWFRNHETHAHYVLSPSKRLRAIRAGAVEISREELDDLIKSHDSSVAIESEGENK